MAKKDDDLHAEAIKIYDYAVKADEHNRTTYEEDIRFARLSEQWPEAIRRRREQEGRPCLTMNKLKSFIRQVVNDARQNKPAIKFHAVGDGADEWTAKVQDGLVRNIEYSSNADVAYDTAIDNAVSGNVGYFRITTDYASDDVFDQDIRIERIANSLSVVPDAYCFDADSANWNDAFVTEDYSIDAFKAKWPKADTSSFEGDGRGMSAGWLEDGLVRVAEWWKRREVPAIIVKLSNGMIVPAEKLDDEEFAGLLEAQGITEVDRRPTRTMKVTQHLMNGVEILETNDWAGKYIPIVPVYGDEVIIDGKRHLFSMIHDAKDAQLSHNFWRSTTAEVAGLAPKAPYVGAVGSFATDQNWNTANTQTHPFLEYDVVEGAPPPQRQGFVGPDAASMQEAMSAADDMKSIMGVYDASLGAQSNETSGRAILARQREGDTSTFNFTDNLSRGIRHAGRIMADLIPKVYTVARVIRTIQEDGTNRDVAINQPTQPSPEEAKEMQERQEQMEGITRIYDLTVGKYDVTCESGPSYNTKRQEAAMQMTEFMRAVPAAGAQIGDLLAKNLDWPGADEIADRLKPKGQDPQTAQMQQQMQQMQGMIQQLQQQLADKDRDKSLDDRKLEIDAFKATTERIDKLGLTLAPEAAAAMGFQLVQPTMQAIDGPDITPGGQQQAPQQPQPMPQQQPEQQAMPMQQPEQQQMQQPPDMGQPM
jgi:hypothetical protein